MREEGRICVTVWTCVPIVLFLVLFHRLDRSRSKKPLVMKGAFCHNIPQSLQFSSLFDISMGLSVCCFVSTILPISRQSGRSGTPPKIKTLKNLCHVHSYSDTPTFQSVTYSVCVEGQYTAIVTKPRISKPEFGMIVDSPRQQLPYLFAIMLHNSRNCHGSHLTGSFFGIEIGWDADVGGQQGLMVALLEF